MPFVLDASIAATWYFQDEFDVRADNAFDLLNDERALVPVHWWFEMGNVVLLGERHRGATEEYSADFLARLDRLPIDIAELPDRATILALARLHRLTFYDAAYLELARREGVTLATLDRQLTAAARAEGVSLVA